MTLRGIPPAHLRFLIEKHSKKLGERRTSQLLAKVNVHDPAERKELLKKLENLEKGTTERLERQWSHYGSSSVYLWRVGAFEGHDLARLETLSKRVRARKKGSVKPGEVRAVSKSIGEDNVSFLLRAGRVVRHQHEGDIKEGVGSTDVDVVFRVYDDDVIAECWGSQSYVQRALVFVLEAMLRQKIPSRRSKNRDEIFELMEFSHDDAREIQDGLDGITVMLKGPPQGHDYRYIAMGSHKDGEHYAPLVMDKLTKAQDQADNFQRSCAFWFEHPDGFKEQSRFTFTLTGKKHIAFNTRSSAAAVRLVVERLLEHLRHNDE